MNDLPPLTKEQRLQIMREERNAFLREYGQRPEVKERIKKMAEERRQKKERTKEYQDEYYKRPEVRERRKKYLKEYKKKNKEKLNEYRKKKRADKKLLTTKQS